MKLNKMTVKIKRRWVKQEKRIVRLMYKKGLLSEFNINDLYWAEYYWVRKKTYKTRAHHYGDKRYRFPVYMPEVHYWTTDYWGESDEHSVVDHVLEMLYWENVDTDNWDSDSGSYPQSTFNRRMGRPQLIKWLNKLPTKVHDNKIKKILRNRLDE